MWFKKILVVVDGWGLPLLVMMTLGAFATATVDGMHNESGITVWQSLSDIAMTDSNDAKGWTLVMLLLGKATLAWAAVRVYMATAGLKWDHFSARWLARSHVVIVAGSADLYVRSAPEGLDKAPLAIDLAHALAADHSVVLAIPLLEDGERKRLWEAGVTVLTGDMPMTQLLRATGLERAKVLVAIRNHHGDNITLTRAAVSPSLGNPHLQVKCLIEPLPVRRDFRVEEYFEASTLPRIRVFNESELVARRILQTYPPDSPVSMSDDQGVHVLVVGLGSVGQSILLQLARMGHYRSGLKPKVTVVDRHVADRWRESRQAHPALEQWLQIETEESRFEDVNKEQIQRWLTDQRPVTAVYVCTKDEIANLRIARMLLQEMKLQLRDGRPVATHVVALDPPGGCVLADFAAYGEHEGRFHLFSLVRGSDDFLTEVNDTRARQFHEDYCRRDDLACQSDATRAPALYNRPWDALDETVRHANRMTADHFEVKLRAIGCRLVPKGQGEPAQFSEDELELLARMDHDRWWADRALDGWKPGQPRDNARKIHPNMVPYEALDDYVKGLDRNSVQQALQILEGEGLVMTRE